jgi:hypothetical protein
LNQTGLVFQKLPERLSALRHEHDRLLGKVAARKRALERLADDVQRLGARMAHEFGPVVAEMQSLSAEIHGLFAELLAPGQLPRRAHKQVAAVYEELRDMGGLPPPLPPDGEEPLPPLENAGGFSASRRPGHSAPIDGIRDVYRRLATAIHPDKVVDEDEKAHRTEVMKQVTVAYGNGDLARLLELERTWAVAAGRGHSTDDIERRAAEVERLNAELRAQLTRLDRELRVLRRSPHGAMAKDLAANRRNGGEDPLATLAQGAQEELAHLRTMRDHIRSFRDRKISLAAFLDGPVSGDEPEAEDELMVMLLGEIAATDGQRRGKKRARRSRAPADECPF